MCLIVFDWNPARPEVLRLAANRDEFHRRPTAPLSHWSLETPLGSAAGLLGGRDLEAGGTWLAGNHRGMVAALTNVRDAQLMAPAAPPSRGELVASVLQSHDHRAWLQRMANGHAQAYAGFNLLVATPFDIWHLHRGAQGTRLTRLAAGVHGLSNASLNTPWPKLTAARRALAHSPAKQWQSHTRAALHDPRQAADSELPDTGIGLTLERKLSAAFIVGEEYGTRASTWLTLTQDGTVTMTEQCFAPLGHLAGEITLSQYPDNK